MRRSLFLCCLILPTLLIAGGQGFKDLSYDQALAQAIQENKFVFIDFYATWCGPCKLMDRTTFKETKVIAWLEQKAVALKVDAEKLTDLAKRFNIEAYPTFVWVNKDGAILQRSTGVLGVDEFMKICDQVDQGIDMVDVAREAASKEPNNPRHRFGYIEALMNRGRQDEAAQAYQTLLADTHSNKIQGVPVELIYMNCARLGAAGKAILDKEYQDLKARLSSDPADPQAVAHYAALLQYQQNATPLLTLYDEHRAKGVSTETLSAFSDMIVPDLLQARRYSEIESLKPVNERLALAESSAAPYLNTDQAESAKQYLVAHKMMCYQVLLGLDRLEEAAALAQKILDLANKDDFYTYNNLAWAGFVSGRALAQSRAWAEKANTMTAGQSGPILDTLAHLMAAMNQRQEAIALIQNAIEAQKDKGGTDLHFLKNTLTYLNTLPNE